MQTEVGKYSPRTSVNGRIVIEPVLEWRGPDINGGQAAGDEYCAVADVLGRDQALAPSPDNPLDGTPELIIVHAGGVRF